MKESNTIRIEKHVNKRYFIELGKEAVLQELKYSLGALLISELFQRKMVSIESREEMGFVDDTIVVSLLVGVNGRELLLEDKSFYKWCSENKPEFIFEYLFTKDNDDEI